jgi:hypothetical protein
MLLLGTSLGLLLRNPHSSEGQVSISDVDSEISLTN